MERINQYIEDLRKAKGLADIQPIPKEHNNEMHFNNKEMASFYKQQYPAVDVYLNGKKVEGIISIHYGLED